MHRRVGWAAIVLLLSAIGAGPRVLAQDAPAPAAPAKGGPEAIAAADIPLRADADERFAQDVIARSKGRDPSTRLEERLNDLDSAIRQKTEFFKRDELRMLPVVRLESLERHWRFYRKQFDGWRGDLKQATAPYTEDAAELGKRRANWEATRDATTSASMAPALNERVRTVLAQLSLAERAISEPLDKQMRLSRRANAVEATIDAGQKAVKAAIAYNDSRLFKIDAPPLWDLGLQEQGGQKTLESLKAGIALETQFIREYNAANTVGQRAYNWFELALLPFLIWLSFRSRKVVSDDPEIQASARVLRRPISSWLLLVMMGLLVVEPDAPMSVHQAALLLALVPVLRLLPPRVYQVLGAWPYVATALYLLNLLSFLFISNAFIYRSYLLFVTLMTLLLILWLLWRSRRRTAAPEATTVDKVVRVAGWLSVLVLLASAVANLVGNVSLAEMLTRALLDSGYVGLVLYAGVSVLASVLRLLMARRSISRFRVVTQHAGPLLQTLTRLLQFAAGVVWLVVAMNSFRVFRPVYGAVRSVLTYSIKFGEISLTPGNVVLFVFSVFLAFWVARTVRVILQDEVLPKMSLPRGVANSVSSLSYYALVLLGLVVALAAAGFEVGQLAFVVGALGVGIGFGLQNVVNNFVSGLILMFERPIQPGDVVEVSGTSGKVREIGMRATTLSTFEGADVVVPNGVLLNEKLINWTLSDMDRRIDVNVGVAYGSDPRKVLELLTEVTRATPGVASEPPPVVLFMGFGASSLDFAIRGWTHEFGEWVKIRSELSVRVYEALAEAGIEIPFPQQDLHLRSISPQAGAALQGRGEQPAD
jgi:potassium efflux system protein